MKKAIHSEFLDSQLNDDLKVIKQAIDSALFVIDCEREGGINNTSDEEARIVMCFLKEALKK